ncbi:hypothetical protein NQ314_011773, partial [Rhamnusium bicolor]
MPGHNSIRISPSGLGLPDKAYYYRDEDDQEYISDVIRYLSTARNEATKFGTDMFSYEKRIAEITPDSISQQNPITTYNSVSISELKETNLCKKWHKFSKKLEEKRLTNSAPEETMMFYALADVPTVEYSSSDHTIIIPRSLLTEPTFKDSYPSSIIYGRLGVEIAEAVVSSVLPYGSLWTADRKILSPFHMTVEESIRTVQSSNKCLSDHISNLNLEIPYDTANETALKTLKHVSAISIANEALTISLEKAEHIHQPSLESYEDSNIFFIIFS